MAGAPKGNSNAKVGRRARQALEKAVYRLSHPDQDHGRCVEGFEALVQMWMKTITDYMEEGNVQGLNAVMDRLDGKPATALTISGDEENPITINKVERVIVKPQDSDS